ncbi:glycosyltransferase [Microbacterium oleivorans]|uniref:Glycosyltransferase n=1 Tax=Microbacterium oleivorans TaxID=273677 RepID=A0A7D5EXD1_9MICO|nr:glycosyltransferase [Microbacterium oleivorans]QLD12266.1 glycosyltransferase [Microbacterium oleivorans]
MSDSVKVVFVDHSSERGGAEMALERLLQTRQDWRASLVVPRALDGRKDAFTSHAEGVEVIRSGPQHSARKTSRGGRLAEVALAWRIARSALGLVTTAAVRQADVVVANTTRASVYVALACALLRKPYAIHVRDLIEAAAIGSAATTLMRRIVLPRATAVIANSRASLALVAPYVRASCLQSVIPSPAGLTIREASQVTVATTATRIGMVARLDPWKGQELLIEAFTKAFSEGNERLVLFGGAAFGHDEFPDELRALALRRGVGERVELAGHTSDVAGAIDSLDICVQSSTRPEPLGQNVLQYLAAGKPTVVADEGGPAEWVTHDVNGLTFTARDDDSLAAALRRLVDDETLRLRLARAAASTPRLLADTDVGAEIHGIVSRIAREHA